jgi:hypothetical protein
VSQGYLRRIGREVVGSGVEEFFQEGAQYFLQKAGVEGAEFRWTDTTLLEAFNAAMAGMVGGGVVGGGMAARQQIVLERVSRELRDAGLVVDGLEVGRRQRVRVDGDREKRGWYAIHEIAGNDGGRILVGSYGIWQGNDNNAQKIVIERNAISPEQSAALKKRIADDRKRADADRQRDADKARRAGIQAQLDSFAAMAERYLSTDPP